MSFLESTSSATDQTMNLGAGARGTRRGNIVEQGGVYLQKGNLLQPGSIIQAKGSSYTYSPTYSLQGLDPTAALASIAEMQANAVPAGTVSPPVVATTTGAGGGLGGQIAGSITGQPISKTTWWIIGSIGLLVVLYFTVFRKH